MIHNTLVGIYKYLLPGIFRDRITMIRNEGGLNTIRKNILAYYGSSGVTVNHEVQMVLNYLKKNPLKLFPYYFPGKYRSSAIKVYRDETRDLFYVLHEDKRMYFKRSWSVKEIQENYTNLLIEQDKDSPHRYLTAGFTITQNDVVADIGAAEGIFSLPIITCVKKIFLFETDGEWIEALQATFSPWMDKVEIINKFVSDKDDEHNITLDRFAANRQVSFDFIKVDVDGAELSLLKGCHQILSASKKIKMAICTYHRADDEKIFRDVFKNSGMSASASKGYMIFYYDGGLSAPYLRRGLLRAIK